MNLLTKKRILLNGIQDLLLRFLSTVHAVTNKQTAEKICDKGFSDSVFKDDGLFGKGVYFSTDADTIPLTTNCIIVSHVLVGEIYPVIGTEANMLPGSPIKRGFNSHYVITNKSGKKAPTKTTAEKYDKVVISEESQIAPVFIIEVEAVKTSEKQKKDEEIEMYELKGSEQEFFE